MLFKMDTRDISSILYFIVLDIIAFVTIPMVSCFIAEGTGGLHSFGNGAEALVLLQLVTLFTAFYIIIIEKSLEYSNQSGAHSHRWTIFLVLIIMNITWTSVSLHSLVNTSTKLNDEKQLGTTLFGCFLASVLFSLSKFTGYLYLYFLIITNSLP